MFNHRYMASPVFKPHRTFILAWNMSENSDPHIVLSYNLFFRDSRCYSTSPKAYWTSSASMQSSSNSLLVPPVSRAAVFSMLWNALPDTDLYVFLCSSMEDSQPLSPPALIACSKQWDPRVEETGTEANESHFCACVSLSIIHAVCLVW